MSVEKVLIFPSVLLVIVLCAIAGCSRTTPGVIPATANKQVLVAKTISAMTQVTSYKLDADVSNTYSVVGGLNPATNTIRWKSTKVVDIARRQMKMSASIDSGYYGSKSSWSFEMYLIGGWQYLNSIQPYTNSPWLREELNDTTWTAEAQIFQQIELLKSAASATLSGAEAIDGVDCYVLNLATTKETTIDWILSQQQPDGPSLGWWHTTTDRSREIYTQAYQGSSFKIWVAKDSYLIQKADINALFEVLPENLKLSDFPIFQKYPMEDTSVTRDKAGFDKITSDFHGEMRFNEYNKPVSIELPQEALGAQ